MSVSKKLRASAGRMHAQAHAGAPTPWRRTRQHVRGHRWAQAGARPLTLAEKTDTREQRCRHARCEADTHTGTNTEASTERSMGLGGRQGRSRRHPETQECGHTQAWTQTRAGALHRHTGQDTNVGTSHTPAQHSLVLRKGDPDTHSEQKHSRAQTHSAFRHSHTL